MACYAVKHLMQVASSLKGEAKTIVIDFILLRPVKNCSQIMKCMAFVLLNKKSILNPRGE